MKRFTIVCLLLAALAYSLPSQAQFFKKLKNTVKNVATSVVEEDQAANTDSGTKNPLGNSDATESKIPLTDIKAFAPKAIYTLQPGEKLDFAESNLYIEFNTITPHLGIKKGGDYFLVVNGKKTKVSGVILKQQARPSWYGYVWVSKYLVNNITEDSLLSQYFSGRMGQFYIKFHQHSYGPYFQIVDFKLNKDHSKFLALVAKINMDKLDSEDSKESANAQSLNNVYKAYNLMLLGSDIKPTLVAHSINGAIVASDNFKMIRVLYEDQSDYNSPQRLVYNPQTGKSIKPPHQHCAIYKPTGDFVRIKTDAVNHIFNAFYMNGELIKAFPHDNYSYRMELKDILISPADHSKWAANNGSEMFFSDGRAAGSVISPHLVYKDGVYQIYWLTLSPDNKTVVLCHAKI